jgi:hypothetical protein
LMGATPTRAAIFLEDVAARDAGRRFAPALRMFGGA